MRAGRRARDRWPINLLLILAACLAVIGAPARANLIINPNYDSSVTSLTSGPVTFTQVKTAFEYAAAKFENTYTDNITINITVVAAPGTSIVGSSGVKFGGPYTYDQIKTFLTADKVTTSDNTAVGSLGPIDPTSGG